MLSAQCDELRAMAESVGLAMPQAATLMMEAADTIFSLRDRAQNLQAENAKLRELVRHLYEYRQLYFKTGIYPTDHGVTEQRMRELGVEVEQ